MWLRDLGLCNDLLSVKVIIAHACLSCSSHLYISWCVSMFMFYWTWTMKKQLKIRIGDSWWQDKGKSTLFSPNLIKLLSNPKMTHFSTYINHINPVPWKQCFRELNPIMLKSVSIPLSLSLTYTHTPSLQRTTKKKPWRKYNKCLHWWASDGRTMDDFCFFNFFYISQFVHDPKLLL